MDKATDETEVAICMGCDAEYAACMGPGEEATPMPEADSSMTNKEAGDCIEQIHMAASGFAIKKVIYDMLYKHGISYSTGESYMDIRARTGKDHPTIAVVLHCAFISMQYVPGVPKGPLALSTVSKDLLKALELIMNYHRDAGNHTPDGALEFAKYAIAQAKGEM